MAGVDGMDIVVKFGEVRQVIVDFIELGVKNVRAEIVDFNTGFGVEMRIDIAGNMATFFDNKNLVFTAKAFGNGCTKEAGTDDDVVVVSDVHGYIIPCVL